MMSDKAAETEKVLERSLIRYARHRRSETVDEIRRLIKTQFPREAGDYAAMDIDAYRDLVGATQEILCDRGFVRKIVDEILPDIRSHLGEERFLVQTNLYLRATRPRIAQETEAIDWHRETFYGANMERAFNIWTPIDGVVEGNTLRFIPGSQSIPESEIVIEQIEDEVTRKGSVGNKVGFLYAPKKIVGGVDLTRSEPMMVPEYHSSIFPGNLIHGAAYNGADRIRFSIDFRILPFSAYDPLTSKDFHYASKKPYFEEY